MRAGGRPRGIERRRFQGQALFFNAAADRDYCSRAHDDRRRDDQRSALARLNVVDYALAPES
jgi:hypothetical protein